MTAEPAVTAIEVLSIVPVRPCTPWCEDGPEDHATQHPDDRSCWSEYLTVPLSRHRPEHYTDGTWRRPWLNVYLRRLPEDAHTTVWIHSEETDTELGLTVAEARTLLAHLSQLVELVERSQ